MYACRKSRFNLSDFLLHAVDDFFGVLSGPGHDHSADRFGTVFHEGRSAKRVADVHGAEVFHVHRCAVVGGDDDIANVVETADEAEAAHDGPGTVL